MAFNLSDAGITDLSTITLNTFAASNAGNLNSYAPVTAITSDTITINTSNQTLGAYEKFAAGNEILFHVSATRNSSYKKYLGRWCVATILSASSGVLTLSKDVTQTLPSGEFSRYYVQAITIAHFDTLKLDSGVSIVPKAYDATSYTGGIVAIKCNTLNLNGGHIDLRDRGIPTANKSLRPWTTLEESAKLDTDPYSGWENAETKDRFLLNCGDGAAFLITLNSYTTMNASTTASRIGNPSTSGAFACRGASDSPNLPEGVTNIGGSTILAVMPHNSLTTSVKNSFGGYKGFNIFAKYRSSSSATGQGLARCYVASHHYTDDLFSGFIFGDGGLAASDNVHTNFACNTIHVKNYKFGDGSFGAKTNYTAQLNNYALATSRSGKTINYTSKTTNGLAKIEAGALIMLHCMQPTDAARNGKFRLYKVLSDNGSQLTLDQTPDSFSSDRSYQIVSIPQFSDFTLSGTNSATPKYENQIGGICAIAVDGTCDLSGGYINVRGKGGSWNNSFTHNSQAQMYARLPIGQGNGSVFILARNLIMNENTRLGSTSSGNALGHEGVFATPITSSGISGKGGGFSGGSVSHNIVGDTFNSYGGHGGAAGYANRISSAGEVKATDGKGGITTFYTDGATGNGYDGSSSVNYQGAHIMIIANTITNFTIAALSTGGESHKSYGNSGCGYGGAGQGYFAAAGGGYHGGGGGGAAAAGGGDGGGASGFAFVYCNTAVNQNLSGIVIADAK